MPQSEDSTSWVVWPERSLLKLMPYDRACVSKPPYGTRVPGPTSTHYSQNSRPFVPKRRSRLIRKKHEGFRDT